MRKGFTLIELLLVIAIMGVLAGLITPKVNSSLRAAKEATCRANLKNLQSAVMSYAADQEADNGKSYLPYAGSHEYHYGDGWHERRGWISWKPKDAGERWTQWNYWSDRQSHAWLMEDAGIFGNDARQAIEFGTLYQYMGYDIGVFACPEAKRSGLLRKRMGNKKGPIYLTYAMNDFFYYDHRHPDWQARILGHIGNQAQIEGNENGDTSKKTSPTADRLLLFAEHSGEYSNTDRNKNCVLTTISNDNCNPSDVDIGCYHTGPGTGWRTTWGLVIFLDGHIEKFQAGKSNGANGSGSQRTTAWWLCRGHSL